VHHDWQNIPFISFIIFSCGDNQKPGSARGDEIVIRTLVLLNMMLLYTYCILYVYCSDWNFLTGSCFL